MNTHPDRREVLVGASAAVAAFTLDVERCRAADDKPRPKTRFLATGGNLFNELWTPLLRYAVSLAGKADPVVCLLPTASGDEANLIVKWYDIAADLPCRPRHVKTFDVTPKTPAFEKRLLSADVIFVSGGNTLNLVAVWKAQEIDAILRKAWEAGTLILGDSAGMIAWFEEGMSDSRPGRYSVVKGLGFLPGSACPHSNEFLRMREYRSAVQEGKMKDGFACSVGTGLLFEDGKFVKAVTAGGPGPSFGRALRVRRDGEKLVEERLTVEQVGK